VVRRIKFDQLWWDNIGSQKLSEGDELKRLHEMKINHELSWDSIYHLYTRSKYWRRIRRIVLKRDKKKCVRCSSVHELHVDHIEYGPMGEENIDKLQTLCLHCHAKKTKKVDLIAKTSREERRIVLNGQLFGVMRR